MASIDARMANMFSDISLPYFLTISGSILISFVFVSCLFNDKARSISKFCWACFLKPFLSKDGCGDQQNNLEMFYKTQANVYDSTREILLNGRERALKLAIAHLKKKKDLVWIDIGGGTGSNIEKMDSFFPISENFTAVYLIDLSPSLCEVAKKRCQTNNWKNVHIICSDASDFKINHACADLITFSYSLSMIPTYYSAIDHAASFLDKDAIISCVDFGVQSSDTSIGRINTLGGLVNRHIPWILRNFWKIWFECDRVFLDPSRRDYLEYKFGTVKSLNLYNVTLGFIPYYIWIGVSQTEESENLMHRINALATESPYLAPVDQNKNDIVPKSKAFEAALKNFEKGLPYPSIFYQQEVWRIFFDEINPQYEQFKNQYIYAFTWEDPREDARILNLSSEDTVLAITSAGDNLLSYACLPDPPRRIHGVDLNPCQNHLTELKLAALRSLTQEEVWKMFGMGKIENFEELLITKLSPHLSSNAFQFWLAKGQKTFNIYGNGLYDTGSTRWALRLVKYLFKLTGSSDDVEELCQAKTLKEQRSIWDQKIKPILFNRFIGRLLVGNPIFLWKALGVPVNQASMIGGSILSYIIGTLDPVIDRSLISTDNYFYYLTLMGHYRKDNCPDYVSKKGYKLLSKSENSPLDRIRLHTDTLNDVFARLSKKRLTVAIIMDHMDWFDPKGVDAINEIKSLHNSLTDNGRVLLRSASVFPWYIKKFEQNGFKCEAVGVRTPGKAIDRINMYASTWVCTKISGHRK
ncbi:hypothetical protein PACTADRAFT_377 [Pachysolen tannophilus NRRL Y-2460]|uniref:Methyltransferase domain-containing protein n=1 Tax=Pachysolen tannophilus NRRL Y-2460 TaxID=669874 RepID=A0A1E4U1J8_PACTA|nr:hypothetical protein PACTADRAFT_377 [Pachysolen tannophilus NRRL Y-2460]